jgi:hypothetical protein
MERNNQLKTAGLIPPFLVTAPLGDLLKSILSQYLDDFLGGESPLPGRH